MELAPDTASRYVRLAFDQMLAVAERLGDPKVNERPLGPDTNAVAAIVLHCCAVAEFWLGHVGLGRESHRDRAAEFTSTATVAELHDLVDASVRQIAADIEALEQGATSPYAEGRQFLPVEAGDATLVLHMLEELFQHLGHCEIAADALLASPPG